jgi:hypothetical protein
MMIVRVTEFEKASEPESINQTIAKASLELGENQKQDENVYSVKEAVAEDLKTLAAMDTTRNKAEEFIRLAAKDGWDDSIDKFNKLYGKRDKQSGVSHLDDVEDANVFELKKLTDLRRSSSMELQITALRSEGSPVGRLFVNQAETESRLINQFYSLIPQDSNTINTLPLVIEYKPDMSYYCIKNISVKRLEQEQFDGIKALQNYKEDFIQSQSLAAVHFNPENIVKRMKFKWVKENEETADNNTPSDSKGDL